MSEKIKDVFKKSYILIILSIFYIPLLYMTVFSFNQQPKKGANVTRFTHGSLKAWEDLFGNAPLHAAIINTIIIGFVVATIVTVLSLITVYSLWKQKHKYRQIAEVTYNIPLINPNIVTAIGFSITFGSMFGILTSSTGLLRIVISHVVMILPYAILIMYPRSEKMDASLLEASTDLGYSKFKSWLKVYIPYMMPVIAAAFGIALTLSFDDFVLARIIGNLDTVGIQLYSTSYIQSWALALGAIIVILMLIASVCVILFKKRKDKVK